MCQILQAVKRLHSYCWSYREGKVQVQINEQHTLRSVSSTLALGKPMSTIFCTMAGSGAALGRITVDALLRTAEALLVPVEQSVRMVMTCPVIRKLHLDSWGWDQRGNTAFTMVACRKNVVAQALRLKSG